MSLQDSRCQELGFHYGCGCSDDEEDARWALSPSASLLVEAERLLAEGQHGPCDGAWRRSVRDYFSNHQRGAVIGTVKVAAGLGTG